MIVTSNISEIRDELQQLFDTFDFDLDVGNQSLGKRMAEKTAEMIASRSIGFQKGASQKWEPNKEPYRSDKAEEYGVYDLAGVRTGQMLSHESLLGETTVEHDEITMVYGIDEPPVGGATRHITKADRKVTDRQKAKWFTEGRSGSSGKQGRNSKGRFTAATATGSQPERPFYELDSDIADEVFKVVLDAADRLLKG